MEKATRSAGEEDYPDGKCYLHFLRLLSCAVLICAFTRPYFDGLTCYSTNGVKTGNFGNLVALCMGMNAWLL